MLWQINFKSLGLPNNWCFGTIRYNLIRYMKKYLLLITLLSLVLFKGLAQRPTLLFSPDSVMKYHAAFEEPPADWYTRGFDDSGWPENTAVIGFGEPSYVHFETHPKSIYYRFRFNVTNAAALKFLNFIADYDDGYIAYLNGREIARVNINPEKEFPAFDDLAIRSHESVLLRTDNYFHVLGVYLGRELLDTCLGEGENMMAVHVLNDSLDGSDLVFIPFIINTNNALFDNWNFFHRYKRLVTIDSSRLPIVMVNTDEKGILFRDEGELDIRFKAHMGIIDNGPGLYNSPDDPFNVYNGDIGMELRGKSSTYFPKQSYRIELNDAYGNDTSFSLLGMPSESDWILFGPFADRSQIRNKLIFELGARLGSYQPRSRFCELILNGQPVGLYALTENIKRDSNRVNISKMKTSDISGMDVTGGYILKYDKNDVNEEYIKGLSSRKVVYPKREDLQPEQKQYLIKYFREYDSVMHNNVFFDRVNGFRKIASDTSLIDYVILNELSKNCDAYAISTFFYKDREDKDNRLKFGPLWDYDLAFGNASFQNGHLTTGWQFDQASNARFEIRRVFQDTSLVHAFQKRWKYLRSNMLSNESLFGMIDSLVGTIGEEVARNYTIWPMIDQIPWYNAGQYPVASYEEEIVRLKGYIAARSAWMDENIDYLYYAPVILSGIQEAETGFFGCSLFPNPFSEALSLEINTGEGGIVSLEVYNLIGQLKLVQQENAGTGYHVFNINTGNLQPGLYIARIFINNALVSTQKVMKR
jgi:hypothetical protein